MNNKTVTPYGGVRARRLYEELTFALSRTDSTALRKWGIYSSARLVKLGGLRIKSLSEFIVSLGKVTVSELQGLINAWRDGRTGEHFGNRTDTALDKSVSLAHSGARLIGGIGSALIDNPKENAPKVLAAFLGFYAGSGGMDGNGGIPDLDLLAGIDAHRSILTHSIIAGVVAEGVLLAVADLAVLVQDNLPYSRDPLWGKLANAAAPLKDSLIAGTSAGVAYHLLVDAGIQPAAYHGLPFEMPMEAHQGIMGVNGLAEARYAARTRYESEYRRRKGEAVTEFNYRQLGRKKTAGQKRLEKSLVLAAEGVDRTVKTVGMLGKSFWDGVKKGYSGKD